VRVRPDETADRGRGDERAVAQPAVDPRVDDEQREREVKELEQLRADADRDQCGREPEPDRDQGGEPAEAASP
jgi:hypothetical protein